MKRAFGVLFLLGVVILVIHSSKTVENPKTSPAPIVDGATAPVSDQTETPDPPEKAQEVSALALWMAYHSNEVAADNAYRDKLLSVTGMVTSISKTILDAIVISLMTPDEFEEVHAVLRQGNEAQAAGLQRGQVVTLICTGAGSFLNAPKLNDCFFQAKRSPQRIPVNTPPQENADTTDQGGTDGTTEASQSTIARDVVSPPVVLYAPEPEFTEAARAAKLNGNVLVSLQVDQAGNPVDVHVIRGLGMGLDEKAVEAVSKYRFKPAMQNGKPIDTTMNVQVNFQVF